MGENLEIILISWQALAFVFAILPGVVGVAYCFDCGKKRVKQTASGYLTMLRTAKRAKSEAYKKTAESLLSSYNRGELVVALAWIFMLIVALVGPSAFVTIVCLVLSAPASGVAYYLGKNRR